MQCTNEPIPVVGKPSLSNGVDDGERAPHSDTARSDCHAHKAPGVERLDAPLVVSAAT